MHRITKGLLLAGCLVLAGCNSEHLVGGVANPPPNGANMSPPEVAHAANAAFLQQSLYNPWQLSSAPGIGPESTIPAYIGSGDTGRKILVGLQQTRVVTFRAGRYTHGVMKPASTVTMPAPLTPGDMETLDMRFGQLEILNGHGGIVQSYTSHGRDWPKLWKTSDIVIKGDPQAQQVTHANLFYLLSSTRPGLANSIPPMGLSSQTYSGHIFWDADVWMLPALIVQHPKSAKTIVDYRYSRLAQAMNNAKLRHRAGAEYPWESAGSGKERAPGTFADERHVTADVAWSAWQYYLWTGDLSFLKSEGWPILKQCANYWTSRVVKEKDGKYHILNVLSPDETTGIVSDDAYTNAIVAASLRDAVRAASLTGQNPNPQWAKIAAQMYIPQDKSLGIPAENDAPLTPRFSAKQADTLLLLFPLNDPYPASVQRKMLAYYTAHTMADGPAMTSNIESVIAARLGLAQQSLTSFKAAYQPFERAPWDAFSEARTTDHVYFLTGMAGCLQSILYGFAGLRVYMAGEKPVGTRLAGDAVASLYANPHLPPGWSGVTIKGVHFRGKTFTLVISSDNKASVVP